MRSKIKRVRLFLLVIISLMAFYTEVIAQPTQPTPDTNMFYSINNDAIAQININTSDVKSITAFANQGTSSSSETDTISPDVVLDAKMDRSTMLLYVVRGPVVFPQKTPKVTRIEQINLTTGASLVVYERQTIVNIRLSPDDSKAVVSYYEGKIGDSPLRMCVLSISKGTCAELGLIIHITSSIYWLDEKTILVSPFSGNKVYFININTQEITLLKRFENWYIESSIPIPQTRNLFIAATPSAPDSQINTVHLLIYEIDTGRLTDYPYQINSDQLAYAQPQLEFSPNGQYFAIGTYVTRRIVEFKTGRVVTELQKVYQVAWPSDNTHVLVSLTSSQTMDTVTVQTLSIDLQTGKPAVVFTTTNPGVVLAP